MTTPANAEPRINEPDAVQIAGFLDSHPDFFDEHPELVAKLRLSHSSGKAVSLIEKQIEVLRGQNEELKTRLLQLVDVARDNDRLNERMHRMTLDLLKSPSLVELLDSLENHLRNEFKADSISIQLPGLGESRRRETNAQNLRLDETVQELFPVVFGEGKPLCGRLKQEQLDFLFRDQAAAIESTAVIPLGERAQQGLLAIGSREVNRFNPCMGTLFLSHLGELLASLLQDRDIS